jgi:hypothetical protein
MGRYAITSGCPDIEEDVEMSTNAAARVTKVRNSGRIREARVRQAMADNTLARTCP